MTRLNVVMTCDSHVYSGNLVISNVRKSDEGTYVCHAESVAGEQSATTSLTVHGKMTSSIADVTVYNFYSFIFSNST